MSIQDLIQMYPNDSELGKAVRETYGKYVPVNIFATLKSVQEGTHCHIMTKESTLKHCYVCKNDTDGKVLTISSFEDGLINVYYDKIIDIKLV